MSNIELEYNGKFYPAALVAEMRKRDRVKTKPDKPEPQKEDDKNTASIEMLRSQYEAKFEKPVANSMKNNESWITEQLEK